MTARATGLDAILDTLPDHVGRTPTDANLPAASEPDLFDPDVGGPADAEGPVTRARERRRGPGRPPGSPNKRTEDLRRFILARYRHPVVALAEIYSMPVDELAAYLDCDRAEALRLQIRAAAETAPYVDARMPTRLHITDNERLPAFGLEFAAGGVSITDAAGNRISIAALAAKAKAVRNQQLGAARGGEAHGGQAHDEGQFIDPHEFSPP